ncbi:hypothetical protein [Demequina salsinemoris]|uniref:hypothetical protein n=1 Tax=Demequina salsinemoris TaxID=577470 RepID=UPI000783ADBB|nr:hypothetical protein [Demequina salsinemoris]
MRTQRTFTAIAAAAVGALLLSGCATDTDAAPAPSTPAVTDSSTTSDTATTGERYVDAAAVTPADDPSEDDGPDLADDARVVNVAVWDQGLSFAAANAFSESTTESIGNTDAMPDYDLDLIAA